MIHPPSSPNSTTQQPTTTDSEFSPLPRTGEGPGVRAISDPDDLRWAVRHWATRIGVNLAQIHLRPMRRKWASISTAGRLTLNPELLKLPP